MNELGRRYDRPLLTVRDVAAKLRVSRATVWRMVAAGRLPPPVYPSWRTPRWVELQCDEAVSQFSDASRVRNAERGA